MVQIQSALDNNVQSNATQMQLDCGPGPMCMMLSRGVQWIHCILNFFYNEVVDSAAVGNS